jgi:HK97 family phage portal protein
MGIFRWFIKRKQTVPKENKVSKTLAIDSNLGTAHWAERDYENFSRETYIKNVIAFRCIFYIASSIASVKWRLFRQKDTEREEITDHAINKILKKANPNDSFVFLVQKAISYLLIAGNTYLERISPIEGEIRELYCLRPDKMTIKTNKDTGIIEKYVYDQRLNFDVDPITLDSDIKHIKMFHPLDDFFGLSITEPTAREIDSSNEATEWQKKVFENEGRPGMVLFINGFLSDDQWDRLENELSRRYSGGINAGKPIIVEGENTGDVKPYAWSPKEMDWIESNRELSRKICIGYGVPPMLMGIPGDNTYSNQKEARSAFWEETVIYYLNLLSGELNDWLLKGEDNIFIDYDLSKVPALAYKMEVAWNRVKDADFLTLDEKRELIGMEKLPNGKGNVVLVNMTQITLDQIVVGANDQSSEIDKQQQEEDEVKKLIEQGYEERIARLMIGSDYE